LRGQHRFAKQIVTILYNLYNSALESRLLGDLSISFLLLNFELIFTHTKPYTQVSLLILICFTHRVVLAYLPAY